MTKTKTKTKHDPSCARAFANLDPLCPRCIELRNGAPARRGWGDRARRHEGERSAAISSHNCQASNCGMVCTYGDW